jgi:acyl-CoA synthetase (AMP-forming)/AMP-acid ligase II
MDAKHPGVAPRERSVPLDAFTGEELFLSLEEAAEARPDEIAIQLAEDAAGELKGVSRARVSELSRRGASFYRSRGLGQGDRVLLEIPAGEGFVAGLLGAFRLGLLPASIAPLHRETRAGRAEWQHLLRLFQPRLVVTSEPRTSVDGVSALPERALVDAKAENAGERVHGSQMRYVQFSSGTTGDPKPLVLEMDRILFNLEAMADRLPVTSRDRCVTWLPMYHDMGLFGSLLLPLYRGIQLTLMDTSVFARFPLSWFKLMDRVRATVTVGTPSAYNAVLDLLQRRPQEGMDLSCCSRFICGAEPITPRLVEKFTRVMAPYGVSETALKPVYGMAENTLATTMPFLSDAPLVDWVERERFESEGRAVPSRAAGDLGWVSVGRVLFGQSLKVASASGDELPDRRVGRLLVRSPSLHSAILRGESLVRRSGEWLDTGDLGYRADGNLYVTGRARDIVIKGGRNVSPERIEELASTASDRTGRCVAFGVPDESRQTERLVVAAEVHPRLAFDAAERDRLRLAVRRELAGAGYQVDEVVLLRRGTLPRTTSGKLRRGATRALYLAGDVRFRPESFVGQRDEDGEW